MDLFDLFARIFLDSSEYEKGLGESEKKAESFGSKLKKGLGTAAKIGGAAIAAVGAAAGAMGTAFVKGAGEVAAYGDQIDKMSQKMGISAQAYQEWDFILQHSGSSIDSMQRGMVTLQKKAVDNAEAFHKLGISQEQLASMSTEDLFAATIEGLQGMEEGAERTALASELLGGAAKELGPLLNTSADDVAAMKQQVNDLGGVMSDDAVKAAAAYQDSLQNMKTALDGAKRGLMTGFLPAITSVMDGLTAIFSGDSSGIGKIKEGIRTFAKQISSAIPEIAKAGGEILVTLTEAILENLPVLLDATITTIKTIVDGLLTAENIGLLVDAALDILMALTDGLIEALPVIMDAITTIITRICERLSDPEAIMQLLDAAWAIIKAIGEGLIRNVPLILEAMANVLGAIFSAIRQKLQPLFDQGKEIIHKIGDGIKSMFNNLVSRGKEIISNIVNGIRGAISSVVSIGRNIVEGIWSGISNGLGWIKSKITGWVGNVMSFIKGLFGISSPSKVMRDQVGKWLARGIGVGFVDEMGNVERMMQNAMPELSAFADADYPLEVTSVDYLPDGTRRGADSRLMEEILGLLRDIRDNMDTDLVLSDGTLIGWMDKALGRRAMQRARGNA